MPGPSSLQEELEHLMAQQSMSLIDVLRPPVNRWLVELARSKSAPPAGVRVVRFGNGDDEELDLPEASSPRTARQKLAG
jgi:hypothetical protein